MQSTFWNAVASSDVLRIYQVIFSLLWDIAREFRFAVDSGGFGRTSILKPRRDPDDRVSCPVHLTVARLNFRTIVETRVPSATREFNFPASERRAREYRYGARRGAN